MQAARTWRTAWHLSVVYGLSPQSPCRTRPLKHPSNARAFNKSSQAEGCNQISAQLHGTLALGLAYALVPHLACSGAQCKAAGAQTNSSCRVKMSTLAGHARYGERTHALTLLFLRDAHMTMMAAAMNTTAMATTIPITAPRLAMPDPSSACEPALPVMASMFSPAMGNIRVDYSAQLSFKSAPTHRPCVHTLCAEQVLAQQLITRSWLLIVMFVRPC